jgi:hypothetical protein
MRNIDAARWIRVAWMCRDLPRGRPDGYPVHGFPWVHLRYDVAAGTWEERPGMCKKATDLRKLVVMLSYDVPTVQTFVKKGTRFDAEFVDLLDREKYLYIDTLPKIGAGARQFRGSVEQFCETLYVERAGAQVFGHYNPYGNFWFAFAIRKEIVNWLDPKPPAYRT